MVINLSELKFVIWHERRHLAFGNGVASNLPAWLVNYIKNDRWVYNSACDLVINDLLASHGIDTSKHHDMTTEQIYSELGGDNDQV